MFNWFKNDVDSILSFLTKAIARLEAHAEAKANETVAHIANAAKSTELGQAAATAQARAQTIAAKLKALL